MATVTSMLSALLIVGEIGLSAIVSYLLLLTAAAFFAKRTTPSRAGEPSSRFLFLIPAHNEEHLLPQTLRNLQQIDYPHKLFVVHVVADNCTDRTAERGRQEGATVHERFDAELRGKGHALEWLLQCIWNNSEPHDAIVILDADTVVSPNFLRVMDARLARGERVIQGYYAVRQSGNNWSVGIRAVALTVLHYLRPLGRMALGGSSGLKGNGMVFAADVLRTHRWSASLTEDIEYHMELILAGERATFAPDAVLWAEMPDSLRAAQSQNERWEKGRMEMIRRFVPRLLAASVHRRSFLLLDAAIEQIIPPFSLVAGASVAALLAALILHSAMGVVLAALIILGQVIYIFTGLILAGAPREVYGSLLFAPAFAVWKIWLYARLLLGIKPNTWVRTTRNKTPMA